jgi:predicted O-methyltransferase YrrM
VKKIDSLLAKIARKRLVGSLNLRGVQQVEPSLICSAVDDVGSNDALFDIALGAIADARRTDLVGLAKDNERLSDAKYYDVFPGEHYRLLSSLCRTLAPPSIIEIGTFTGMSAAAILRGLPEKSKLTTFDISAWRDFDSHLSEKDFASGRIAQVLDDLSDPSKFEKYRDLFIHSRIIFLDAPKDGVFEHRFLSNLARLQPASSCLMILDDIRVLDMCDVWRSIQSPKLDLTSFGHWSGTGLVDMSAGLKLRA